MSKKSKEGSYGFVYLWRDRKHNKFYIGSHWGFEDDGYICSSNNMRENYRYRKSDFKRRILSKVFTDRKELLEVEQRWIDLIKPEEFGRRYYNVNAKVGRYAWWMNEDTKAEVVSKRRETFVNNVNSLSEEDRLARWQHLKNPEIMEKARQGRVKAGNYSQTNMQKMRSGRKNFLHSKETRLKMSSSAIGKNLGKKRYNNGEIAILCYEHEVPEGFVPGHLQSTIMKMRKSNQ